jgi:hypothetical protein
VTPTPPGGCSCQELAAARATIAAQATRIAELEGQGATAAAVTEGPPEGARAAPPATSPETEAAAPAPAAPDFITADPAACTVTPRTPEEMAALAASPNQAGAQSLQTAVATPGLALPAGPPADAATVAAVVDTFRQFSACLNAGQPLAAYALWTDDALRQSVIAAPTGTPTPVPAAERAAFRVGPVRALADGRVAAVVERRFPLFADATAYILVPQDGRYLIDETLDMDLTSAP